MQRETSNDSFLDYGFKSLLTEKVYHFFDILTSLIYTFLVDCNETHRI